MTERTLATVARALEARADHPGVFSGYASLFGTADSQGDVVEPGAFRTSLEAWRTKGRRPAMLWQHDPNEPIGLWTHLEEDAVGLRVEGRLLLSVQAGAEAHEHLKMGTVLGTCLDYVPGTGALTIRRSESFGSGTYSDWTVSVDGGAGPEGPAGPIGSTPQIATSTAATLTIQPGTTSSFTTAADLPLLVGAFVLMTANADPSAWMMGQIAGKAGTSVAVDVQALNGSGTHSGWTLQLVGPRGIQGPTGPAGGLSLADMHAAVYSF
ncbi:MAG: HK97 family phage prohead protease [Rhodospirillaceae bacterium]|nr:HK97 family phage prohead protease [Rhodospirillaceae bacterium]